MNPFFAEPTLLQNLISLASAGLGAFLAMAVGVSHRQLCALISFAAGALLATTFFHIVPEALQFLSFGGVFIALVSGYHLFFLVSRHIFHVCPACAASHFEEQTASSLGRIAFLLVVAFGVHCVMDGLAIALGGELTGKVDRSIFLTVTVHKFPEGLALCALLMRSGFHKLKSFFLTCALEALTFFGWLAGLSLLKGLHVGAWFYFLLAYVGGSFIYLALHAVLNETKEHAPRYILFFFLMGIAMVGFTSLIPT